MHRLRFFFLGTIIDSKAPDQLFSPPSQSCCVPKKSFLAAGSGGKHIAIARWVTTLFYTFSVTTSVALKHGGSSISIIYPSKRSGLVAETLEFLPDFGSDSCWNVCCVKFLVKKFSLWVFFKVEVPLNSGDDPHSESLTVTVQIWETEKLNRT